MGVRILSNSNDEMAALYCSTSDVAFGPLFYQSDEYSAEMRAQSFLRYLGALDARLFAEADLLQVYSDWLAQEADQWKREEKEQDDHVI